MNLREWLKSVPKSQRLMLCRDCEIAISYSYQLGGGFRSPSLSLAKKIQAFTKGKVNTHSWPVPKRDRV